MVVQMSSLRVASDLDASGYARGAKQIDAANASMAASSRSVGASISDTAGRISRSGDAISQLERRYVAGARQAQAFEAGLRRLGGVVENDASQLQRAVSVLAGMQQQFGLTANAAELAGRGWAGAARIANALAVSIEDVTMSQMEMTVRAAALRAQIDPLGTAQARMNKELAEYQALAAHGVITTTELAKAQELARSRLAATAEAMHSVSANDNAAGFRRQNLGFQVQDIGVSLYGGMPVGTVLIQQGSQILGLYQGNGGVNAALKDFSAIVASAVRYIGPFAAVGALAYGAYRLLAQYTAQAAIAVDETTKSLAEQAAPLEGLRGQIDSLTSLQKTYTTAILDGSKASTDATAAIIANTEREFNARKSLLELEEKRQQALLKTQQAELLSQQITLRGELAKAVTTRDDLQAQGFADPKAGSVPFVRLPDSVTGLQKTMDMIAKSPAADRIKELRAQIELAEIGVEQLRKALEKTFQTAPSRLQFDKDRDPGLDYEEAGRERRRINELRQAEQERTDARIKGIRAVTDQEKIAAAVAAAGTGITNSTERRIREENAALEERTRLEVEAARGARDRDIQRQGDIARQQLDLDLIGKSVGETARLQYQFEQLAAVKEEAARAGRVVSPEEVAAIDAAATAIGRMTEQMTLANAQRDLLFEREQLGRSREEQQVYAEIRRLGLDINSAAGQQIATTMRINAAIEKQRDMWEDIASTVAGIFSQPLKDVDDLFSRLASGFAKMGEQNIENLFQGLMGGTGGKASSASAPVNAGNALSKIGDFLGGIFTDRKVIGAQNRAINTASQQITVKPLVNAMGEVGTAVAKTTGQMQSSITAYANAIKSVESSGNYFAQGPVVAKGMYAGQRAQGAYQVMPGNIPSWTKELLGYSVTTQEFLRSRSIQDGVFQQQFMKSFNKYGNFMDAASVWFTGKPLSKAGGANDGYLKVEEYVSRASKNLADPAEITSAVASGTKQGIKAIATVGGGAGAGSGAAGSINAPGGAGPTGAAGNGLTFGSVANIALSGLGMGYQSQSAGMGAIGGFLSGLSTGNPVAAVIGGIAGAIGGLFGARSKRKQEEKQARQQLDQNRTAIAQLFALGEGRGIGSATQSYNEFYDKTAQLDEVAQKAGDDELVQKLRNNVNKFFIVLEKDFIGKLPGVMEAYSSGQGSSSPFMQGVSAMEQLREELKNFIADAKDFGELQLKHNRDLTPEQLNQRVADAERAAQQMVLSSISGVRELGEMEKQVLAVKGATATAVPALEQFGMNAVAAAKAVDGMLNVALAKLKDKYISGLVASINELSGLGYLNSIMDAQVTYQQRLADAAQVGEDGSLAIRELSLSIGEIVRQAGLGSTELQMLAGAFPQLQFILNGVSTSTMTVADATSQLQAAYEKEASALDDLISASKNGIAAIKQFRDSMKLGSSSPLAPNEKVAEAMKQLRDLADKAAAGDTSALDKLTQAGQSALDEARSYYASSTDYFEIWKEVEAIMARVQGATEGQLSKAEQQKKALDASVSGILKVNDSVVSVREAIDNFNQAQKANTDLLATQLALIGKAGTASIDAAYKANLDRATDSSGGAYWQNQIASGKTVDQVVDAIANSREAQINALYKQVFGRPLDTESRAYWVNSGKSIEQITADLQYAKTQGAYARGGIVGAYAAGGRVGNGLYNADSVRARYAGGGDIMLAGGEAVVRATSVTSQTWPMIDHINRTGTVPGNDNSALLAELRGLRQTVETQSAMIAALASALAGNAKQQSETAKKTVAILSDVSSELKLASSSR